MGCTKFTSANIELSHQTPIPIKCKLGHCHIGCFELIRWKTPNRKRFAVQDVGNPFLRPGGTVTHFRDSPIERRVQEISLRAFVRIRPNFIFPRPATLDSIKWMFIFVSLRLWISGSLRPGLSCKLFLGKVTINPIKHIVLESHDQHIDALEQNEELEAAQTQKISMSHN